MSLIAKIVGTAVAITIASVGWGAFSTQTAAAQERNVVSDVGHIREMQNMQAMLGADALSELDGQTDAGWQFTPSIGAEHRILTGENGAWVAISRATTGAIVVSNAAESRSLGILTTYPAIADLTGLGVGEWAIAGEVAAFVERNRAEVESNPVAEAVAFIESALDFEGVSA